MAKVLMIQGTMSNAGKSLITAGLCRVFKQDGYRVAPFKSQNMALNSYITSEGLEMGRAQVMQAEAAGIEPLVCMNPILLKPTSDNGSQIIVNGKPIGNMRSREYFQYKKQLVPEIVKAFEQLSEMVDIILIEGAGSPAEINLKENDIVNMGMAKLVDSNVLLVGDIDRGGVFAQLLGTLMLLEEDEKSRVKGLVVNKFRGDKTILDPGIDMLEEKGNIPVVGVVPYTKLSIDDEDSLSERIDTRSEGLINISVIRLPHMSNFSDYLVFDEIEGVSLNYITNISDIEKADMLILPGTKNTIGDLKWLRESGMEAAIKKYSEHNPVCGICGGYQMLGLSISDPDGIEEGGDIVGMGLLNMRTVLKGDKTTTQVEGTVNDVAGLLNKLSGMSVTGYEIHMGVSTTVDDTDAHTYADTEDCVEECALSRKSDAPDYSSKLPLLNQSGNVYGTYLHGFFDAEGIAGCIAQELANAKGVKLDTDGLMSHQAFKEKQYDILADVIRNSFEMDAVYNMLNEARICEK